MAAAVLITLAQAKTHLHITTTDDDVDIQFKLDQAEDTIRRYLKKRDDPAWTPATVPHAVQSAILLWLTRLYEQRGDDEGNDAKVWTAIEHLLVGYRDPALA